MILKDILIVLMGAPVQEYDSYEKVEILKVQKIIRKSDFVTKRCRNGWLRSKHFYTWYAVSSKPCTQGFAAPFNMSVHTCNV
jgi:hypothetical protein